MYFLSITLNCNSKVSIVSYSIVSAPHGDLYHLTIDALNEIGTSIKYENRAKPNTYQLSDKDMLLMNLGVFSLQINYYQGKVTNCDALSLRLYKGALNPRVVFMNEDILTPEQMDRLYSYINRILSDRNLKIAFRKNDAFKKTIPIMRIIKGETLKIYLFIKMVHINDPLPKSNWGARGKGIVKRILQDEEMIGNLKKQVQHMQQMNNDGAESGQWTVIAFELLSLLGIFVSFNKRNKKSNAEILDTVREDIRGGKLKLQGGAKCVPETIPLTNRP